MPADETTAWLDATAVRVLAHPLRSRLLSRLRVAGPATATDLATALSTNTGATSYHLRRLEAVGLVTDTGEGEGKRRLWRATTASHGWHRSTFADDEDAEVALDWLERSYVRQVATGAEAWLDAVGDWPTEWADATGLNDTVVTVTPAQLRALTEELRAVTERYRAAATEDPEARQVKVSLLTHPVDVDRAPGS